MQAEFAVPIPGTKVIGLGHRARHGKDTVAAAILDHADDAKRFSFADDLYAYCRIVHGMTVKDAPLLQRVGVEWRETDPNVWVRAVYSKILDAAPSLAVITDVRFPNEMAFVRAMGGVCVRVLRRNADDSLFIDPSRPADHISEIALEQAEWDYTIMNTRGVPELRESAIQLLDQLGIDPWVSPCCGEFAQCREACTPRGEWLAKRLASPINCNGLDGWRNCPSTCTPETGCTYYREGQS